MTKFKDLFCGYKEAYGRFTPAVGVAEGVGKKTGKASTIKGELPSTLYQDHLDGGCTSLGIIPLQANDTVRFAAIDIDNYNLKKTDINQLFDGTRKYPFVFCKSKSGGIHIYSFFKEDVLAADVCIKLRDIANSLGLANVEIFPKQTMRANDIDVGNWINLPYFGKDTARYAFTKTEEKLTLREFEALATECRMTSDEVNALKVVEDDLMKEAPPCLVRLYNAGGFPQGTKNTGMLSLLVYLKKRYPKKWQSKAMLYARKFCSEKVPQAEIDNIIASLERVDYKYGCKKSPLCEVCESMVCTTKKYGIQSSENFEISAVTRYESKPVVWGLEIAGKRVLMSTENLMRQESFARECVEQANILLPKMKQKDWEAFLQMIIKKASSVAIEGEVSQSGITLSHIAKFCLREGKAQDIEEVSLGKVYHTKDKAYFIFTELVDFLDSRRVSAVKDINELRRIIKEQLGGGCIEKDAIVCKRLKAPFRLWYVTTDKLL